MDWFTSLNYIWIAIALVTFTSLVFTKIRAPYGRHTTKGWGPMISNKWGWFWMELPAFLIFPLLAIFGPRDKDILSCILIGMWSFHYFNRTLIFPFRLKTKGKKMPLTIPLSAIFFNGMNGFLNGYYLGYLAPADSIWNRALVILGISLFGIGFLINYITDQKLIALRKKKEGYSIPQGWLFEKISCPNHFGEIIEWTGFALAAGSLPAATFAIWTFCNLAPRALNHHEWYHEHFEKYPKGRKAFIPYLW